MIWRTAWRRRPDRLPRGRGDDGRAVHAGAGRATGAFAVVAENHQEKNARALEQAGGCRVLLEKDASPQRLYDEIGELLSDRERLRQMGRDATRLAAHDASEKIYREIMQAVRERQK